MTPSNLWSRWGGRRIPTRKQWRQHWIQETFSSKPGHSLSPTCILGCKGQRWTVQTCLTCQRSQRFLNNPRHVLWGDRPEAQLGNQAGERGLRKWGLTQRVETMGNGVLQRTNGWVWGWCEKCQSSKTNSAHLLRSQTTTALAKHSPPHSSPASWGESAASELQSPVMDSPCLPNKF